MSLEEIRKKSPEARVFAKNIQWDTDGDEGLKVSLPYCLEIPRNIRDDEEASDWLSNQTGFCHSSFTLTRTRLQAGDIIRVKGLAKDLWCKQLPANTEIDAEAVVLQHSLGYTKIPVYLKDMNGKKDVRVTLRVPREILPIGHTPALFP